jgi:dUTP pyrophosphatase
MSRAEVRVQLKRLAGSEDLPLPQYQTADSAAVDLRAAVIEPVALHPGDIKLIPTGLAIALPPGYEAQVRPRSGLAVKHGLSLPNTPATIDADYRGEIQIPLINHGKATVTIERGMRIAQMLVTPVPRIVWDVVDELPASIRGTGGFGHTGN